MVGVKNFELKRFLSSEREMLHWRSGKANSFYSEAWG
jgi:hypothetical protein